MFVTLVPAKLIENEALAAKLHQFGVQIGFGNVIQYLVVTGIAAAVIMAVLGWNFLKKQSVTV